MTNKKTNIKPITEAKTEPTKVQINNNSSEATSLGNNLLVEQNSTRDSLDSHTTKCEQLAEKYSCNYPNETEFHITSDYQVFLGKSKSFAQNHQCSQISGELITIKVK